MCSGVGTSVPAKFIRSTPKSQQTRVGEGNSRSLPLFLLIPVFRRNLPGPSRSKSQQAKLRV